MIQIRYIRRFEGVRIFEVPRFGTGRRSAGLALPGIGIFVGTGVFSSQLDIDTVRHEYGHILQARKIGLVKFYFFIGIPSLISAWTSGFGKGHQNYWTELWCNELCRCYFGEESWDIRRFPCRDLKERTKRWLYPVKI